MYLALIDNNITEASPNLEGTCPLCKQKVISRCGNINIWHWAHNSEIDCDSWIKPESKWHFNWKMSFGKENSEVSIENNNEKHRADVKTSNQLIIEFQNSPISTDDIIDREEFYGYEMIWVINGEKSRNRIKFKGSINNKKCWIDLINEKMIINEGWYVNQFSVSDEKLIEVEINEDTLFSFTWSNPKRSWRESERDIFIDFGGNYLFYVQEGKGYTTGNGWFISKKKFITQHGGDYDYYKIHMLDNN